MRDGYSGALWRGVEKICPVCGRRFFVGDQEGYAYKRSWYHTEKGVRNQWVMYFCRWSCMRKWDKQQEEEKENRPKPGKRCGNCRHNIYNALEDCESCVLNPATRVHRDKAACKRCGKRDVEAEGEEGGHQDGKR